MHIVTFPTARAARRPRPPARPLAEMIADFLLDMQVAGLRPLTRKKHRQELRRFGRWLDMAALTWEHATEDDLVAFLRTRAHLKTSTRAAAVGSLRVFYRWAVERRALPLSPAEGLRTPRRDKPTPLALTKAQIRVLRDYLRSRKGTRARRDEVLFWTALYTGLRRAELANLEWAHLDLDEGVLTIELSKMNHGRATALHGDLIALLRGWQAIQAPASPYVFADVRQGLPITAERVGKIVRAIKAATGLSHLHTHRLRHSFATWTLRESKDLHSVSKALGHATLAQTEVYIAAALGVSQIAAAISQLPGIEDW